MAGSSEKFALIKGDLGFWEVSPLYPVFPVLADVVGLLSIWSPNRASTVAGVLCSRDDQ